MQSYDGDISDSVDTDNIVKKFLDMSGLGRLVSLIISFVTSYAAPKSHNHDSVYAKTSHNHTISNISNLQAQLDSKQAKGSYASSSHTHTTSQVANLDSKISELDKATTELYKTKAHNTHQHSAGDITSGTLPLSRGGTGGTNAWAACVNIRAPYGLEHANLKIVTGMTVVAIHQGDRTANVESFASLTNKCGYSVGRYNCAIMPTTSDFAACPTVWASYCSVDSIGIQVQQGNQCRINYMILCWK